MASTKADNNRVAWSYTDDGGTTYAMSAKAVYVLGDDAAKFGGSAPAATVRRLPKEVRPRKVKCISAGHPDKWMVAYEVDCDLWTVAGTSVTLDINGLDIIYASTATRRGEKSRDTTRQTA